LIPSRKGIEPEAEGARGEVGGLFLNKLEFGEPMPGEVDHDRNELLRVLGCAGGWGGGESDPLCGSLTLC
jgi:hypothetical protein